MPSSTTKTEIALYWIATFLVAALMLFAIINYHLEYEAMAGYFEQLGYPTYIVYPLAYLKLAALLAIISNRYGNLKDIAYGAYFINMCFATVAHLNAGHWPVHAFVGLIAIPVSYLLSNRVRGKPSRNLFILDERAKT